MHVLRVVHVNESTYVISSELAEEALAARLTEGALERERSGSRLKTQADLVHLKGTFLKFFLHTMEAATSVDFGMDKVKELMRKGASQRLPVRLF